jgi:hypothetical protein
MLEDGTIRDSMAGGVPAVEAMDFGQMPVGSLMNAMREETNAKRGSRV